MSEGINCVVTLVVVPAEDILCGVEKAIGAFDEDTAEDVKHKTDMILKGSCKPKDSLTGVQQRSPRSLKANVELTVFPADKGNAVLSTADYNQKIAALLKDQAYRKLKKDPIEFVEHKTILLLKISSLSGQVCQQFQPQDLRPMRLYRLLKIHKQGGVPSRPNMSTVRAPT
jgi:hypothetical protein